MVMQYHIVFTPKYRKQIVCVGLKKENRKSIKRIIHIETNRDNRSRSIQRLYTYMYQNTLKYIVSSITRIFKRKN